MLRCYLYYLFRQDLCHYLTTIAVVLKKCLYYLKNGCSWLDSSEKTDVHYFSVRRIEGEIHDIYICKSNKTSAGNWCLLVSSSSSSSEKRHCILLRLSFPLRSNKKNAAIKFSRSLLKFSEAKGVR